VLQQLQHCRQRHSHTRVLKAVQQCDNVCGPDGLLLLLLLQHGGEGGLKGCCALLLGEAGIEGLCGQGSNCWVLNMLPRTAGVATADASSPLLLLLLLLLLRVVLELLLLWPGAVRAAMPNVRAMC
jgi:hypothetical protein